MSGDLKAELRDALSGRVVVVGIGNPLRGDDGVGCRIADQLAACSSELRPGVTVVNAEEVPESHLGPVITAQPDVVLLVDAAEFGGHPGDATLMDADALDARVLATHRTPLAPIARFLESETGATVMLLGVQPGDQRWGAEPGECVAAAARDLATLLLEALAAPEASIA